MIGTGWCIREELLCRIDPVWWVWLTDWMMKSNDWKGERRKGQEKGYAPSRVASHTCCEAGDKQGAVREHRAQARGDLGQRPSETGKHTQDVEE